MFKRVVPFFCLFFLPCFLFGRPLLVRKIEFLGVPPLDLPVVLNTIQLVKNQPFSSELLSEDLKRLYQSRRFSKVRAEVKPYGDGVKVVFICIPNPLIERVLITGRENIEAEEIAKVLYSKKGKFYHPTFAKEDEERIKKLYREEGYFFVHVSHKIRKLDSGKVELLFVIREGPLLELYDVSLRGNHSFSEQEVLQYLRSSYVYSYRHQPWYLRWLAYLGYLLFSWIQDYPYVEKKIQKDMEIIRMFYRSKGFLDAQVFLEKLEISSSGRRAKVVFRVLEGRRYKVRKVDFAIQGKAILGKVASSSEKKRLFWKKITLKPGEFFSSEKMFQDIKTIRGIYEKHAYVFGRVEPQFIYDRHRAVLDLIYRIQEGKKIRIERILFRGNRRTKDWVIRRYLTFAPGEWYDGEKIQKSQYKINSLQYFEKFEMKLEKGSREDTRNVVFEVKEGRTGSFIIGGAITSDFGFFGNFQFVQRNFDITDFPKSLEDFLSGNAFVGGGQTLSISLQPGIQYSNYNIRFSEPFLFGYPIIFGLTGYFYNRDQLDYVEERMGGNITLGHRFSPDLIVQLTLEHQRINIFDLPFNPPQDLIDISGKSTLNTLEISFVYDLLKVDKFFIAYGGFRLFGSYEYAGNVLRGNYHYSKAFLEGKTYFWIFGGEESKHILMLRAMGGWAEANRGQKKVPLFSRFFLGGNRSLRGFQYRGVGHVANFVRLGGHVMVFGSVEYQFPLLGNFLRGVLFSDAGKLAQSISDMRKADFRVSWGFGFLIRLPVFPAPIRLFFGFPIKKNPEDDLQTFHFDLGFNF